MKKCMGCMRDYDEKELSCPLCGYSEMQIKIDKENYPEALCAGSILDGRFILGRTLSVNNFSNVYISWDALLCKRVVVKEYFPFGLGIRENNIQEIIFRSEQERELFETGRTVFEQEARVLNQNQDLEEIIKIYRIVQENDTSYIIMEYVEGITLQDYLDDGEGIGREMAEDFIRELAGIVDAIHSRGIIHYHLSPKNIYLDNLGRIRILDFGDAKKEIYRILGPDINILDLRYTAPEVLQREKAGAGADLYSLGAIGYRLLTGKEPPLSRPRRKKKTGLKADTSEVGQAIEKLTTPIIQKRPESAVQALLSNGSREEKQYG